MSRAAPNPAHRGRNRRLGVGAIVCAGALLAGASALGAAEPPATTGPVVELPKFEVKDSRLLPPQETWHYAQIPGFEILSNISKSATKRFVDDFLLLQMVTEIIVPGMTRTNVPVPTALILCKGNSFEQFVSTDQSGVRFGKNALLYQNPERAAIVVDFALAELTLSDNSTEEADPYRGFYLDYFRNLIRKQTPKLPPPWFEEGLVQIFAAMDFNRKWITFAQIGDGFGGEKIGDFNRRLSRRALIPFRNFLEPERSKERGTFWEAQCYAWVHMCLYGRNQKYQRPFVEYLRRIDQEPATEELFKQCFKKTYKQMELELRGYLEFTDYKAMQFTAKKGQELPKPPPIELTTAKDADVGRIKGEVLRLAGYGDAARLALVAPYVRGERDPRLLAALGLDEKLAGEDERARKFLEAAATAKVDRARAYLELARLRLAEAKAKPAGGDGKLNEAQVTAVLTPLFTARGLQPPMADVYALIAETWTLSKQAPERGHFEVVIEGVRKFPRDATLLMEATLLAARRGFAKDAVELAKLGARVAREPAERDRFEMIASSLEAPLPAEITVEPKTEGAPARTPGPLLPSLK